MTFSDLNLDAALLRAIADLGFTEPTPIQRESIQPALEGRDILAAAMTGSGKTAAFALPTLQRLARRPGRGPRVLVLTPTRELASQVHEAFVELGRYTSIKSTSVFGGVKPAPQIKALRAGVDVVVACPGRLLDHMQHPWMSFDRLEVLILDEADRMLDMGFLPDVRRIMSRLPKRRQNLLFSATMPREIVRLSADMLDNPFKVDIERKAAPATGIRQAVLPVPETLKPALLIELLRRREVDTALVFTRTKHRANRLFQKLERAGISADRIHGNRSQNQRQLALKAFKNGELQVLVATDIAQRGIDVAELPHVINFDVPGQTEDYIHRVGRTARAAASGTALTFFSPAEETSIRAIERAVGRRIERFTLEGFDYRANNNERLEVPIGQRIAEIRARKAADRARGAAKAKRRQEAGSAPSAPRGDNSAPKPRRRRRRRSPVRS